MWIKHKFKDGDTLASIAKQYKNKDPNAILLYEGNKKISAALKKGEPLKAGTVVWVLDPKGRVYLIETAKGVAVLIEKEFKALQKEIHAKMDAVLERQRINYNYAVDRHDAQLAIHKDQWFVAAVVTTFSSEDEPDWKPAQAAYKKLKAVVSKRDYKNFEAAAVGCEKAVVDYTNKVHAWIQDLIDTAEGTVTVLEGVKVAGQICGTLALVTIAAPATLGAAMVVGGASSASVGLVYDCYENVSLDVNGMKSRSAGEIGKRLLTNAVTGALAAGVLAKVMPLFKAPFLKAVMNNSFLKAQAARLGQGLGKKVFEKELAIAIKKGFPDLAARGTVYVTEMYDRVMIEAAFKFLMRSGNAMLHKWIGTSKGITYIGDVLIDWIKTAPSELQTKDGKGVGEAATRAVLKSGKVDGIFDMMLADNRSEFDKVLQGVLKTHLEKAAKKQAA